MPSDVDIGNMALTLLGQQPILQLTDNVKAARSLNRIYAMVRDNELRAHIWNFATTRTKLPALSTIPAFGYNLAYQLPPDCLQVIQVGDAAPGGMLWLGITQSDASDYKIEGRTIVTNWTAPLSVRYIARVTDPTLFDSCFVNAFACRLAMRLCEDMTAISGKRQLAQNEYKEAIVTALRANAIELPPDPLPDNSWLLSRSPG